MPLATTQKPHLLVDEAFGRIAEALYGDTWAGMEAYRERRWDDRTTTSSNRWRSSPEEAKRLLAQPKNPIFASNKPLWPAPDSKEYQEEYEAWCRHVSVVNKLNEIMADYDVESRFRDARYGGPDHAIDSANWDSRNHLFWFNLSTNLGGYGGSADGEIRIDRPGFDAAFGKLFFPEEVQSAKPGLTPEMQSEGGSKSRYYKGFQNLVDFVRDDLGEKLTHGKFLRCLGKKIAEFKDESLDGSWSPRPPIKGCDNIYVDRNNTVFWEEDDRAQARMVSLKTGSLREYINRANDSAR